MAGMRAQEQCSPLGVWIKAQLWRMRVTSTPTLMATGTFQARPVRFLLVLILATNLVFKAPQIFKLSCEPQRLRLNGSNMQSGAQRRLEVKVRTRKLLSSASEKKEERARRDADLAAKLAKLNGAGSAAPVEACVKSAPTPASAEKDLGPGARGTSQLASLKKHHSNKVGGTYTYLRSKSD